MKRASDSAAPVAVEVPEPVTDIPSAAGIRSFTLPTAGLPYCTVKATVVEWLRAVPALFVPVAVTVTVKFCGP